MRVLFSENVCENERIGSGGGHAPENFVCRSANEYNILWFGIWTVHTRSNHFYLKLQIGIIKKRN